MTSSKPERKRERDAKADAVASAEAAELLDAMRDDVAKVTAFLDAAVAELDDEPPGAKRVARLRLMSEDLASARKLAAKLGKD